MFNIVSESMEPTFYKDDLAIVRKCTLKELKKGDIITFNQDDRTISHRILQITKEKGDIKFITKGDNNDVPDKEQVEFEDIYGKVLFVIPAYNEEQNIKKVLENLRRPKHFL